MGHLETLNWLISWISPGGSLSYAAKRPAWDQGKWWHLPPTDTDTAVQCICFVKATEVWNYEGMRYPKGMKLVRFMMQMHSSKSLEAMIHMQRFQYVHECYWTPKSAQEQRGSEWYLFSLAKTSCNKERLADQPGQSCCNFTAFIHLWNWMSTETPRHLPSLR